MENSFLVKEIFTSFQGEGRMLGKRATFIRLAGCNLACPWCDEDGATMYALTMDEIAECVYANTVILTGGEPTLQDIDKLAGYLKSVKPGLRVAVETNGTNKINRRYIDWVTCSPKPGTNYTINPGLQYSELKYVVDDTFDPSVIPETSKTVWLQPQWFDKESSVEKIEKILKDSPRNWRFGIQAHKYWGLR